jgi:uncharacterized protein (DUF1499 family)
MTDPTPEHATPQHGPIVTETAETKTTKPAPVLSKRARFRRWVLRLTLLLVIASPLVFILAGLGAKFGIWSWQFGLSTLTRQVGPLLLAATLIMGLFSVLLAFFIKPRKGLIIAGLAIVIPLAAFVQLNSVRAKAGSLPLIHDITTDTQDPPTFGTVIMAERAATFGVNTVDYDGKRAPTADRDANGQPVTRLVSALQTQAYPEIRTLVLSVDPGIAFGRAEQVARDLGWEIQESDAAAGRIDATATTFWYGFKDDIAIRLRPASGGGTRVDIRSVSRVGLSDLGANAARIEAFLDRMKE